jgi:Ca-activated chloride channel homolog
VSVAHPALLLVALSFAAGVAWLFAWLDGRRRADAFTYSSLPFLLDAAQISRWPARILIGALALSVLLGGIALAGVRLVVPVPVRGGAVVLCLDTSGSMRATDIEPSREAAVRMAARTFAQTAPEGTRIALAAFSSAAQQVSELTDDKSAILDAIQNIPPANGGTAIGECLALAGRILPNSGRRAIVLVTDGVNNSGVDPLEAATALGARGVQIFTVGIGTNGSGIAIPGTNQEASIDEDALRAIASSGHGSYTRIGDAAGLTETFRALARSTVWQRQRVDLSFPLALVSAGAMLVTLTGALLAGRFP